MVAALKRVRNLATQVRLNGESLINDAAFVRKLDAADVKLQAIQYTEFRIMAQLSKGQNPGPESSIMKNMSSDMGQHLTELSVEAMGYYSSPLPGEAETPAPREGAVSFLRYFNLRASSIAGGSNEVQKNIVAKLVLGL